MFIASSIYGGRACGWQTLLQHKLVGHHDGILGRQNEKCFAPHLLEGGLGR